MTVTPTDIADSEGPNASLNFGEAGQNQQLAASLKNQAPGAYAAVNPQPRNPGQQQPPAGPHPGLPGYTPMGGPPVQPPDPTVRLNGAAVFPPPRITQQPMPWRDRLRVWASHPQAGPALRSLADLVASQKGPLDR